MSAHINFTEHSATSEIVCPSDEYKHQWQKSRDTTAVVWNEQQPK